MKPFILKPKERENGAIYSFKMPKSVDKELDEISKATKVPKQEIIRQMIFHCLRTIEFTPIAKEQKNETDF